MSRDVVQHQVEQLHRAYGGMVYRRARTLLRDEHAAEDATQEVFVRVIENLDAFRGQSSPVTWLYRVTTNLCIDRLRRHARRRETVLSVELEERLTRLGPQPDDALASRQHVQKLLRHVDSQTLQILLYRHVDGMTQTEIAETLGVTRKTVFNKLKRLRRRFDVAEDPTDD